MSPFTQREVGAAEFRGRLLTAEQMMRQAPPAWLVDGLIPKGCLALLYGAPGVGKSFLALDLAIRAAGCCSSWMGRDLHAARVLYVAAESPYAMGPRIRAAVDAAAVDADHLHEWLAFYPRAVNLSVPQEVEAVLDYACASGVEVVILDTWARCTVGVEENSAKDIGIVVSHLDVLRQNGMTVLVVHHPGKDPARGGRGSSALLGAVDVELSLVQPHNGKPERTLTNTKQKDAVAADPIGLRLVEAGDSAVFEYLGAAAKTRKTTLMDRISGYLAEVAPAPRSKTRIRKDVIGNTTAKDHALRTLVTEGFVTREGDDYRWVRDYIAAHDPQSDTYDPVGADRALIVTSAFASPPDRADLR